MATLGECPPHVEEVVAADTDEQTTVVGANRITNPGGTGSPAAVISASPAPLPPRRSTMPRSPSAKSYTQRSKVSILPPFVAAGVYVRSLATPQRSI